MTMFLLVSGRHICVPQRDVNMAASQNKALQIWVTHFSEYLPNEKTAQTRILARLFAYSFRFLNLFISTLVSKLAKKQIKQAEKIQLSMEMTPLLQDNSEDTVSTSYHLSDEV